LTGRLDRTDYGQLVRCMRSVLVPMIWFFANDLRR
jgi:hypothetical protein